MNTVQMEDNKELEAIVQRMIDAGEPEENIAKVIQEFDRKSVETVKTTPVAKDATAGEEIASDTVLPSEDGSSELIGPSETPESDSSFVPFESPEAVVVLTNKLPPLVILILSVPLV